MMHATSFESTGDEQEPMLTEADWEATEQLMQQREIQLKAELQESEQRCDELRKTSEVSETPISQPRVGRLSDRIESLRSKCLEGLGELVFVQVYSLLKETSTHAGDEATQVELQQMMGSTNYATYGAQMESLVFMEQSLYT